MIWQGLRGRWALPGALLCALALLGGCAFPVVGLAQAAPSVSAGIDPSFIRGTDGGEDDRLAAATLRDLEGFWTASFPTLGPGRTFTPLRGYYSVDSTKRVGQTTPCLTAPREIEGNAFYCPRADILAYDRAALLPVLRQQFGDSAVVVVLGHEFGHAIQQRVDQSAGGPGEAGDVPTILSEGQADCFAGLFVRAVRDGRTPDLRTGATGVDSAMRALVVFRDPVGTGAGDDEAHGNGFDRVTSFQLGFEGTPQTCGGMTVANRQFTQRAFTSLQDQSSGGNLGVTELLTAMGPDLDRFFARVVSDRGRAWSPAPLTPGSAACGDRTGTEMQGPIAFCDAPRTVRVDTGPVLAAQHRRVGDYTTGTLLASRYGLAALAALGRPTTGRDAGRAALCLAGAYTGSVGAPGSNFALSPGDLDEAVQLLLRSDDPVRDAAGAPGADTGYDRVRVFRTGVSGGVGPCLDGPL